MSFDSKDGLNLTVGTGSGQVLVYDIRSSKPYAIKEQGESHPAVISNGKSTCS